MNIPFGKRMYVVTARVMVPEDGPADAFAAVMGALEAGRFIDAKVDSVTGPVELDWTATLPEVEPVNPVEPE